MKEHAEIPEYLRKNTAAIRTGFIRYGLLPRYNQEEPTLTPEKAEEAFRGIIDYAVGPMSVFLEVRSRELVKEAEKFKKDLEEKGY